ASRAQDAVSAMREIEERHQLLQAQVGHSREEAAEKRTVNAHLRQQMQELRARIDELEKLSTCPTCRRPMDPPHKARLRDEYSDQGTALRDRFRAHEAEYRKL